MKKMFGLLFFFSFLTITSLVGQQNPLSEWKYVNPLPFTYDIHSASFVSDNLGWVTGKDGTINRTTDGGKTWSYQIHSRQADLHDLRAIYFFNDKIGWAVGLYGNIVYTGNGGEKWEVQTSGTQEMLYSVKFVSKFIGFALGGNGKSLKTSDGGASWYNMPATGAEILSSHFINENLGYAAGYGYPNNRMKCVVAKTTDAGQSWKRTYLDSVGAFNSCHFIDSLHGWVVGNYGKVYRTTDAGSTWEKVKIDSLKNFTAISFKNEFIGCIASQYDSIIYNTTDGGNSWKGVSINTAASLTNIVFTNNLVYASGLGGIIYVSSDNGKTWYSLSSYVTHSNLLSASFSGNSDGWAVGYNGTIINTNDGGKTWYSQQSNTFNALNSVFFIDSLKGVACGYESTMLRTEDGGEIWNKISIDSSGMHLNNIFLLDRNIGYCCGTDKNYKSIILKSTDGGLSWKNINTPLNDHGLSSIYFKDSLNGWLCGYDLYYTSNGGETWTAQTTGQINPLYQVVFSDSLHGWAMGYFIFLRTTNGGRTWNSITMKEHNSNSLYFKDAYEGWRVGSYGYIYHSTDGGYSWHTDSRSNPELNFVTSSGNKIFAFGEYGAILTTPIDEVNSVSYREWDTKSLEYTLYQNYPNPFNPSTSIQYSLKESGKVDLAVYNMLGQKVLTLVNEFQHNGNHQIKFDASHLASGIYIYRIKANNFTSSKKLLLLK